MMLVNQYEQQETRCIWCLVCLVASNVGPTIIRTLFSLSNRYYMKTSFHIRTYIYMCQVYMTCIIISSTVNNSVFWVMC